MNPKILIACNSRGRMLDICLTETPMREAIWGIFSDHKCGAQEVAKKHGVENLCAEEESDDRLSTKLLELCKENKIDYIVSTGFTRLFKGDILEEYKGRILNTHFSMLPAFPGHKSSDWTAKTFPPRDIFERMLAYGSRITGNTIHLVDSTIDGGAPIMQSSLVLPYDETPEIARHRLFIQECQCFMQMILWLRDKRLYIEKEHPYIADAKFNNPNFSPALEEAWLHNFDLPFNTQQISG